MLIHWLAPFVTQAQTAPLAPAVPDAQALTAVEVHCLEFISASQLTPLEKQQASSLMGNWLRIDPARAALVYRNWTRIFTEFRGANPAQVEAFRATARAQVALPAYAARGALEAWETRVVAVHEPI